MLLQVPGVLTPDELARVRALVLASDQWADGNATSGEQAAMAKRNRQLPEDSPPAAEAGALIRDAVRRSPLFMSAALPHTVYPPLFNRYGVADAFDDHVDNAMRFHRPTGIRIRTDLSATLFLTDPEDYDGGELIVEDTYGVHEVKLQAGDMILYPATSLHRVQPITRGVRTSSFFWVQSLVRDDGERTLLFDMDLAIQQLAAQVGQAAPAIVAMTGAYHNLLRRWAEL